MEIRDKKFDNIRGMLIFLVVFGHSLELFSGEGVKAVYLSIYSFHMPVFVFLTGYFAKFDIKRIVRKIIVPFAVWNTIYIVIFVLILGSISNDSFKFPYWLTWYLMSMAIWYLLIPVIDCGGSRKRAVIFAISVAASLLSGFVSIFGYGFSLGRTVTFLPFFIGGFYARKYGILDSLKASVKALSAVTACGCVLVCLLFSRHMPQSCFYGAAPYSRVINMAYRGLSLLSGAGWSVLLVSFVSSQKYPIITAAGKYSAGIYVFHGIVIKLIAVLAPAMVFRQSVSLAVCFAGAFILVTAFGNKYVYRAYELISLQRLGRKQA